MAQSPGNLDELVRRIAWNVGATEAAAFAVKQDPFDGQRIDLLIHLRPDTADADIRAASVAAFKEIVSRCVQQAKDGAIWIEGTDTDQGKQWCLVTLARRDAKVVGVAAFIVRCPDEQYARTILTRVHPVTSGF